MLICKSISFNHSGNWDYLFFHWDFPQKATSFRVRRLKSSFYILALSWASVSCLCIMTFTITWNYLLLFCLSFVPYHFPRVQYKPPQNQAFYLAASPALVASKMALGKYAYFLFWKKLFVLLLLLLFLLLQFWYPRIQNFKILDKYLNFYVLYLHCQLVDIRILWVFKLLN